MYGAVGAKTNSSYGKMYRQITKLSSKAIEKQFNTFNLLNLFII